MDECNSNWFEAYHKLAGITAAEIAISAKISAIVLDIADFEERILTHLPIDIYLNFSI